MVYEFPLSFSSNCLFLTRIIIPKLSKMASKQSKCVRQGVSKLQSADRELKKNRVDKSNGVSEARPRSLPRDIRSKASNASKAPNAGSRHQAGHNKLRSVITMGSPPKTAPGLNNLSNETVSVNGQVEADVVFPGHNATSLPPGPHSSMPHLNMDGMPTEVLQMIWGEVINAPACHTFRIKAVNHPKVRTKWAVELWVKDGPDTSAYQRWKELLLGLKNIGFHMAFRHFVKHVQPIDLKLFNERHKVCSTTAAIDEAHDLVILEMDRGQALPWFQHADSYSSSMDGELVRERMRHFRRVAIHYKSGQLGFAGGAAFLCLCERTIQPHGDYNACPLTLACFLDLFQSLEQFYFVVDAKLVWHKKFASQYRGMCNQYRSPLSNQTELIIY